MSFQICTEITITPRDPEGECAPQDLDQVGAHPIEFVCNSRDSLHVHAEALAALKRTIWIQYPEQFSFEVAYPEGASVKSLDSVEAEETED